MQLIKEGFLEEEEFEAYSKGEGNDSYKTLKWEQTG